MSFFKVVPCGRRLVVASFVVLGVVWGSIPVAGAGAQALAPKWDITAGERPTNLTPAAGKNEVQELVVNATGGEYALVDSQALPPHTEISKFPQYPNSYVVLEYNAPASVVQAGLAKIFGAGTVEVSGGPGGPGGLAPYVITFPYKSVPVLFAFGEDFEAFPNALQGEVNVSELATGEAPIPQELVVRAQNRGGANTNGETVITDTLPAGLKAIAVSSGLSSGSASCTVKPLLKCTFTEALGRVGELEMWISVVVLPSAATGEQNTATVSGGGASAMTVSHPIEVNGTTRFGIEEFSAFSDGTLGQDESEATQAGAHPYQMTTTIRFNTRTGGVHTSLPVGEVKELEVGLPAGVVVNPTATPTLCTEAQLLANANQNGTGCPDSSQVGVVHLIIGDGLSTFVQVYNMVPPTGEPAQLGFVVEGTATVHILPKIRTGSDSGISATVPGTPEVNLREASLTLWGEPSSATHDQQRGDCGFPTHLEASCPTERTHKALLTLPSSCAGPLTTTIRANSWEEPDHFVEDSFVTDSTEALKGCSRLGLTPSFTAAPDTSSADTPAGLTFDLTTPQEGLLAPNALAPPDLRTTTVTLPAGVAINPGQAAGLVACQAGEDAVGTENAPSCPDASKVGTVEITTPLLSNKFYGNVYVLQSNPPNLQLLVEASSEGVNVKLVGTVHLDPVTGQLTTTFRDTPQLPFTNLKLSFSGGAQAALTTPTKCGVFTTTGDFTPWSSPFAADTITEGSFAVDRGPGGSGCPSTPLPFSPGLTAGSTTDQAGGFTSFSLLLQSGDAQQRIEKLAFKAPPGLSGMLSAVPLCPEPQAAQGTCSSASQIGHAAVASGPGPYPLVIPQPGNPESPIYLTGSYKGAPFGLTIVTHVIAGPFDLGNVITRAKIEVDPHTAQITVTTDALPQIIDGVPTDLRLVNSVIDRPGFMFNPTNCNPSSFSGTAWGTPPPGVGGPGATASIGSHFQVGSCQSLKFAPGFKVSTSGKTSRSMGASLNAEVIYPPVPVGANQAAGEANIASVKVDLPKQLPSRLTTLQKACTAAQFEANPAGCPAASVIGHATAITQVLPVPLTGPAIFVSHGGEAFPSLIIVLQGYGVTVDLVASTFISKAGITSSTFKTLPDVPFKTFDLNLPEGKYSALAANGNLCKSKLAMPTAFVGQNGAVIHVSTKIAVTGCPKAKKAAKHHKRHGKGKKGKRKKA
jgi:hypothetical protein